MPEKSWGRRHEFIVLDTAALTSLLQLAFPGKQVIAMELLTDGHCNTNYKIKLSGLDDTFVVRFYARDRTTCQKDLDIFNLVAERVPVPEILYADTNGSHYKIPFAVMRWVEGELLSNILTHGNLDIIAKSAYEVGATLAHIGTYTFPQAGFFGPGLAITQPINLVAQSTNNETATFLGAIEQYLFKDNASQQLGTTLTDRLWQFVTTNVGYLTESEKTPSLVHADFKGINILVRQKQKYGGWEVSAVLDWEFAIAGSPLFDVGNILRYDRLYPPEFEKNFICGYQDSGGYLPKEWKKITKLLDLINLCKFLTSPMQRGTMIEEVKGLIVGTLEHWEEYEKQ